MSRRVLRRAAVVVGLLAAYAALRALFAAKDDGVLSPSGSVDTSVLALGVVVVGLRLVVVFALPAAVAWWVVGWLCGARRRVSSAAA